MSRTAGADPRQQNRIRSCGNFGVFNVRGFRQTFPRFRDTNLDLVSLVNAPGDFDGTLVDFQGRVLGMWASFAYQTGRDLTQVNMGIQSDVVVDMLEKLRKKEPLRSIEVDAGLDKRTGEIVRATRTGIDVPNPQGGEPLFFAPDAGFGRDWKPDPAHFDKQIGKLL